MEITDFIRRLTTSTPIRQILYPTPLRDSRPGVPGILREWKDTVAEATVSPCYSSFLSDRSLYTYETFSPSSIW
jgi:hypothetical protein